MPILPADASTAPSITDGQVLAALLLVAVLAGATWRAFHLARNRGSGRASNNQRNRD